MKHVYDFDKSILPLAFLEKMIDRFGALPGRVPIHDGLIKLISTETAKAYENICANSDKKGLPDYTMIL